MYVYVCVYIYTHAYVHTYTHIYTHTYIHIYALQTYYTQAHKKEGDGTALKPATAQGLTPMEKTMEGASDEHKGKVPLNDWAAVQCQTSVNWSTG